MSTKYTNKSPKWTTLDIINKILQQNVFLDSFGRGSKKLSPLWKPKNWINTHDDGQCIYEKTCGQHCL